MENTQPSEADELEDADEPPFIPECELIFEDGPDSKLLSENCKKNHGHSSFIPIKDLDLNHLPPTHRSHVQLDYMKYCSDMTVKVTVKSTSLNRPDVYPNSTAPYPYGKYKGNKRLVRVGTGTLVPFSNAQIIKDSTCPCPLCKSSEKRNKQKEFYTVTVSTAVHVVFDDSEAENAEIELFYDSEDRESVRTIYGIKSLKSNKGSSTKECTEEFVKVLFDDVFEMTCVTHDKQLFEKLLDMIRSDTYFCKPRYARPMPFIISHPHGCSKHLTIGTNTHRVLLLPPNHPRDTPFTIKRGTSCRFTKNATASSKNVFKRLVNREVSCKGVEGFTLREELTLSLPCDATTFYESRVESDLLFFTFCLQPWVVFPSGTRFTLNENSSINPPETRITESVNTATNPSETRLTEIRTTAKNPSETRLTEIGSTTTNFSDTILTEIGSTTNSSDTILTEIGSAATNPFETRLSEIGSTATNPSKTTLTEIGSTKTNPSETTLTEIVSTATNPSETRLTEIGCTTTNPSKTRLTEIGSTATNPSETRFTEIGSAATNSSETRLTEIGCTATNPSNTRLTEIGSTATNPSETRFTEIGSAATNSSETRLTEIGCTATNPSKTRLTEIGSTATNPSETRFTEIGSAATNSPDTSLIEIGDNITSPIETQFTVSGNSTSDSEQIITERKNNKIGSAEARFTLSKSETTTNPSGERLAESVCGVRMDVSFELPGVEFKVDNREIQEDFFKSGPILRWYQLYDIDTCPGCSGAPVLFGKPNPSFHYWLSHAGALHKRRVNRSGYFDSNL